MLLKSHLAFDIQDLAKYGSLQLPVASKDLALSTVAILLVLFIASWVIEEYKFWQWPVVNNASLWNKRKAMEVFLMDARKLVYDGFAKFPKGYSMDTDLRRFILLSPNYANEIRSNPGLHFMMSTERDFLAYLPGFEIFRHDERTNKLVLDMIRTKLTQSSDSLTHDISNEMTDVLHEQWKEDYDWHEVHPKNTMLQIIARVSSRVFLGPEICRDPKWLRITTDYTIEVFMAMAAIKRWPRFMYPIVHMFLPESRVVRARSVEAHSVVQAIVDKRMKEIELKKQSNDDAMGWMHELAGGQPYDAVNAQLGLSFAGIHTTVDLTTQVLYDICQHPELIEALREEVISVLRDGGWKKSSLHKMKLMDSVLKESQRLKPPSIISMRRFAISDVTLQDGLRIPKGSMIGVSGHWGWDSSFYENPEQFDGYRFVKLAQNPETEKTSSFVSTSPQHLAFGHGKHACPGRFFAANEVKIVLTHILLKYDLKFAGNSRPEVLKQGWMMVSDSDIKLLVRRRREEISLS